MPGVRAKESSREVKQKLDEKKSSVEEEDQEVSGSPWPTCEALRHVIWNIWILFRIVTLFRPSMRRGCLHRLP